MKKAIEITKKEIEWHKEYQGNTIGFWDGFIKGMEHLLELFETNEDDTPPV